MEIPDMATTSETTQKAPPSVPRWLVRTIWVAHRAVYRLTPGRFGLRPATSSQWGMLRLRTIGRQSGKARLAIVGFIEDGPNLITPAMNGWAEPDPAWWLNLQANPEATVELPGGSRNVTGRVAIGEERARLWDRFLSLNSSAFTDASAALRSKETAIVVLEPRLD
jgi:deazaflavin-dependent oxidoreductase (nitroreductase family)